MSSELTFDAGAAVVAGGSGGIGAAIARRFAAADVPVVITYRHNEAGALQIKDDIKAIGKVCFCFHTDLVKPESVEALFGDTQAQLGRIAHVIYAAGPSFEFNFIGAIPPTEWRSVIDSDLNGAFHLIQNAVKSFRAHGGGNLIAVTTSAVERAPVRDSMSAAPKAAIEMLVRGVAKESGRYGIRANCVGPGWINVGLGKRGLEEKLDAATREGIRRLIPLQSFGTAEDIAWAALFLCSREARYISGQSLAVDGGLQL
jgi:NAD(P)-dependent dehydrogenase (short-subunit alcohol dehydrogenase family)